VRVEAKEKNKKNIRGSKVKKREKIIPKK